jgi:hypothetical protein
MIFFPELIDYLDSDEGGNSHAGRVDPSILDTDDSEMIEDAAMGADGEGGAGCGHAGSATLNGMR